MTLYLHQETRYKPWKQWVYFIIMGCCWSFVGMPFGPSISLKQELSPPVTIADTVVRNTAQVHLGDVNTFLKLVKDINGELQEYANQIVLSFGMNKELETPENVQQAFKAISNKTVRAGFAGLDRKRAIQFVLNVKLYVTDILQK